MDNIKTEKWTLEDGRRSERRISEKVDENGSTEQVIEVFTEEARPLRLSQRVVEKRKPFVYERNIETVDETGNVVERKTEALEPKINLQLVEHIAVSENSDIIAQSVSDCVTQEDLIAAVTAAVKASKEAETPNFHGIRSLGVAEQISKNVEKTQWKPDIANIIMLGFVGVMVAAIVYMIFFV